MTSAAHWTIWARRAVSVKVRSGRCALGCIPVRYCRPCGRFFGCVVYKLRPHGLWAGRTALGLEDHLPGGLLLTTVEQVAGYVRKSSVWPATFGLACCAFELMSAGGPRHDLARFGMERMSATPRQADLMIVAGRVSQKMAPVLRQIYDQMSEPKWVISMGVCASSGGMFNNYAIVQGVDHLV